MMCTFLGLLVLLDLVTLGRQLRIMKNNITHGWCCTRAKKKRRKSPYIVETSLPSTSQYASPMEYTNYSTYTTMNNGYKGKQHKASSKKNGHLPKSKKENSNQYDWSSLDQEKYGYNMYDENGFYDADNTFDVMEYNYGSLVKNNTGSSGYATEYSYGGSLTGRFDRMPTTSLEHRRKIALPSPDHDFDYNSIQRLGSTKI